jgi:glycosyltransferase involved in cell wall biosynthesis
VARRSTRVLFVTWRDLAHHQAGGSELVADRLLTGLRERGYEVALLSGTPLASHEYPAVASGGTYSQYLIAPLVYWRRFRGWDVVVDVDNGIPFFAPLWRRGPVICLVHHVHTDQWALYFPKAIAWFGRWLESRGMPFVYRHSLFVAVSDSTKRSLVELGIAPERIRTAPNGIDAIGPSPQSPRSEGPLFLSLGRLVPHKRVELLLDVWEKVRPVTGGKLVIVGEGPERARLERLAGPDVEFTGFVPDDERVAWLDRAWFLVHTTMHEGWGMTVMEGAVRGTPSIALDVVGLRDSIVDDRTGVLVESTDDLAQAWIDLALDAPRRERYSEGARGWAAEHSWDRAVDTVAELVDAAAARPGRR